MNSIERAPTLSYHSRSVYGLGNEEKTAQKEMHEMTQGIRSNFAFKGAYCDPRTAFNPSFHYSDINNGYRNSSVIARYECVPLGHVDVFKFESYGFTRAERTFQHIEADRLDSFLVPFPLLSDLTICQFGKSQVIHPGTFGLHSTRQPSISLLSGVGSKSTFSEIFLKIPGPLLRSRFSSIDEFLFPAISTGVGIGRIIRELVEVCLEETHMLSIQQQEHLGNMLINMVLDSILETPKSCKENDSYHSGRDRVEKKARSFIECNITNPSLDADLIASHCHVSRRYLQMIFASWNMTVNSYIKEVRLQRCHNDLRNSAFRNRHISDIAMNWGFSDLVQFSKAYRATYGKSPREERTLLLRSASAN